MRSQLVYAIRSVLCGRRVLRASVCGLALAVVVGATTFGLAQERATAPRPPVIGMLVEEPSDGSTVGIPFVVRGLALAGPIGLLYGNAGISQVLLEVIAGPALGELGSATLGQADPRGVRFGPAFTNIGWTFTVTDPLPPGNYQMRVTATSLPDPAQATTVTTEQLVSFTVDVFAEPPPFLPPGPGSPRTLDDLECLPGQLPQWSGAQWGCTAGVPGPAGPPRTSRPSRTPGVHWTRRTPGAHRTPRTDRAPGTRRARRRRGGGWARRHHR